MIKFNDLNLQFEDNKKKYFENISYVIKNGVTFGGEHELEIKNFVSNCYNNSNVQLTTSGTTALQAALIALELPKKSRVLIPTMTYAATAQAVVSVGCLPTFVDIDESWLLDFEHLEVIYELYNKEISAVIVVDLYGQGCDIVKLNNWCKERNLKLIIDAAQSFGLCEKNYDQTITDAVCLSFSAYKNFGGISGGGAVVSKKIAVEKLFAACIQGKTVPGPDGRIEQHGLNFRITGMQSALIAANIPKYLERKFKKINIIKKYYDAFNNYREKIIFPTSAFHNTFHWYVFPISPFNYNEVCNNLKKENIEFAHHYKFPLHKENFYENDNKHTCKRGEILANKILSLPTHVHLSESQIDHVIDTVISAL